jgi:hypothetical protein
LSRRSEGEPSALEGRAKGLKAPTSGSEGWSHAYVGRKNGLRIVSKPHGGRPWPLEHASQGPGEKSAELEGETDGLERRMSGFEGPSGGLEGPAAGPERATRELEVFSGRSEIIPQRPDSRIAGPESDPTGSRSSILRHESSSPCRKMFRSGLISPNLNSAVAFLSSTHTIRVHAWFRFSGSSASWGCSSWALSSEFGCRGMSRWSRRPVPRRAPGYGSIPGPRCTTVRAAGTTGIRRPGSSCPRRPPVQPATGRRTDRAVGEGAVPG